MGAGTHVFLALLVGSAVAVVAGYVVAFVAVAMWTAARRNRPDRLAAELDRVLDDILQRRSPAPAHHRRRDRGRVG